MLFSSFFQKSNLGNFTTLFIYGYSACGSPQLSCFSDICTATSNSIPVLKEKWVSRTSSLFSICTRSFFASKKPQTPLSHGRLDVPGSTPGLELIFLLFLCVCVVIQCTARTKGKLQLGGEQEKPLQNSQELKRFGKLCRRKLPAGKDEVGALLPTEEVLISRLSLK